jgi:hypothetical protein
VSIEELRRQCIAEGGTFHVTHAGVYCWSEAMRDWAGPCDESWAAYRERVYPRGTIIYDHGEVFERWFASKRERCRPNG